MRNTKEEIVIVKKGRFKGQEFRLEGVIDEDLPFLASQGNYAAKNALEIDKYTLQDVPFFYGKIGSLGYVISQHDLGVKPKTAFVMPRY